jgi:hypothetical protein
MKDSCGSYPYNVLLSDTGSALGIYGSEYEAVTAWASIFRGKSKEYEYGTFVLSRVKYGSEIYYLSHTYRGMADDENRVAMKRANVVVRLSYYINIWS